MIPGQQRIKKIYFLLYRALGGEGRIYREIKRRKHVTVLNLHKVGPDSNPYWSPLHPRRFEDLLRFITARFQVTTFGGLREATDDRRPQLILSFDDGYFDYLEYAIPLLEKYGLPSNQNVIADSVRSGQPPANVRLSEFLGAAPVALIREIKLPGFTRKLRNESTEEKIAFGNELSRFLKLRPQAEAEAFFKELETVTAKLDHFETSRMLTVEEIRQIAKRHEIGCHSATHASMQFESPAFFDEDLKRCMRFFREELRLPLTAYAFPNGSWRQENLDTLKQGGIEHVLLVGNGFTTREATAHKRFNYYADSKSEARLRALGFTSTRA